MAYTAGGLDRPLTKPEDTVATTNDIKNGTVLKLEGQLWNIIEFQHVKPGKGGAFVRTKMRNVMSGKVVDKPFNAGLKIETATVDRRDYQYLYQDGADFVFMDTSDFDQLTVPAATVGDATNFMLENQMVNIAIHEGNPLYIELPPSVVLEITYTEPGLQGDRSSAGTKPATLETGYEIQVPLFVVNKRIRSSTPTPWKSSRAWSPTRPPSTSSSKPTRRAGRSSGCRPWTASSCAWAPGNSSTTTTSPTASR